MDQLETYLEKTGQTMAELCEGANQVGPYHIFNELVPKALEKDKKIVWIVENEELATGHYELVDLKKSRKK